MRNQQDGLNPCLNMLITVKNYPATRQRHKWIFRRQLLGYVAKTKLLQMADQVFEKKIKIKRNCNGLDDFGISIERLHVSLCLYINICGLLRRKKNLESFYFSGCEISVMASSKAKQIVQSNSVVVFSKSYCPFCVTVKKLLDDLGATYKAMELDVESNFLSLRCFSSWFLFCIRLQISDLYYFTRFSIVSIPTFKQ